MHNEHLPGDGGQDELQVLGHVRLHYPHHILHQLPLIIREETEKIKSAPEKTVLRERGQTVGDKKINAYAQSAEYKKGASP